MESYYGQIKLGDIVNTGDNAKDIGLLTARFVHYPDCQQLIVWLPEYGGRGYGTLRLVAQGTDTVVEQSLVAERINGSVQILWDTLPLAPDRYLLEIEHPKGGKHLLYFVKYAATDQATNVPPPMIAHSPQANSVDEYNASARRVYRDGFGNELVEQDLVLREKALLQLQEHFSRRVEFDGTYRSGTVIYIEGDIRLEFYHEMYGGNYHFGIDIPPESEWEQRTNMPLHRRQDIIEFVAQAVQREKAPNWQYIIRERDIAFFG